VQIDGVGYYLFTFYVAPLYAESIKLRYFTLSTVNEKVNAYLNSTAHEPSEIGTIASTAKSFFSDSYFKTWKDASDCQCISFNVLVSDFGADQLSRAGLDAAAFKAALRTMKLTVACSQPASDAISIISDEIVLSAIDETDLVPGCIYEDASWTQLAATGTSNTYMCVYHS